MTQVSMIIPVYNVEEYLDRCLESVCSQDLSLCVDIEILLIDDGSTDDSGVMCDKWAERDARIRVVHKENGGLSDARNVGMQMACGEYIMFVDSDDYLVPDCIKKLYLEAKAKSLDVLRGSRQTVFEDGRIEIDNKRDPLLGSVRNGLVFLCEAYRKDLYEAAVWQGIYRRLFILENELWFKKGIYHEDELWMPLVMRKAKRVDYIKLAFYCYVQRSGSIINRKNKEKHGQDLMDTARYLAGVTDIEKSMKRIWYNLVTGLYFYGVNSGKFIRLGKTELLSKKFVAKYGMTSKNFLRSAAFIINYRFYDLINHIYFHFCDD